MREGGGGEEEGGLAGSQAGRHTGLLRRSIVPISIESAKLTSMSQKIGIVRHSMHRRQREVGKGNQEPILTGRGLETTTADEGVDTLVP